MKMPLLLLYDFLLVCFCVCFSCFVLWKRPSAVLAIAILDWRAISRNFPNLHAFVIYLISRCCFMYWTWVKKIGVPSTVKMTPNSRIVFQEYFSLYAGLFGQPKVICRYSLLRLHFSTQQSISCFPPLYDKSTKAQGSSFTSGRGLKICAVHHYGPFYLNIQAKWLYRFLLRYDSAVICLNVNFDTGIHTLNISL